MVMGELPERMRHGGSRLWKVNTWSSSLSEGRLLSHAFGGKAAEFVLTRAIRHRLRAVGLCHDLPQRRELLFALGLLGRALTGDIGELSERLPLGRARDAER